MVTIVTQSYWKYLTATNTQDQVTPSIFRGCDSTQSAVSRIRTPKTGLNAIRKEDYGAPPVEPINHFPYVRENVDCEIDSSQQGYG